MKKIQNFFTDKGSVSVKTRNILKTEMLIEIKNYLSKNYPDILVGTDGAFYIPIGEANGRSIYTRLEMTISVKEPN